MLLEYAIGFGIDAVTLALYIFIACLCKRLISEQELDVQPSRSRSADTNI